MKDDTHGEGPHRSNIYRKQIERPTVTLPLSQIEPLTVTLPLSVPDGGLAASHKYDTRGEGPQRSNIYRKQIEPLASDSDFTAVGRRRASCQP